MCKFSIGNIYQRLDMSVQAQHYDDRKRGVNGPKVEYPIVYVHLQYDEMQP
jgi:hypothetical protein